MSLGTTYGLGNTVRKEQTGDLGFGVGNCWVKLFMGTTSAKGFCRCIFFEKKKRREGKKSRGGLIEVQVWFVKLCLLVGKWGWFRDGGFFHEGLRDPGRRSNAAAR